MPVVRVGSEKTVAALADRLLKARTSQAATDRVHAAIVAANPGIDPRRLRRGDLVVVPESDELLRSVDDVTARGPDAAVESVRRQLESWQESVSVAAETAAVERTEMAKLSKDRTLSTVAAEDKTLAATLETLGTNLAEENTRAKKTAKLRPERVKRWSESLDEIRSLLP